MSVKSRKPWVDMGQTQDDLARFFETKGKDISRFGSTVNQTFEALMFASILSHYREKGWDVKIINPINPLTSKEEFKLKFSTRGQPGKYSFGKCMKDNTTVEVRHQLRVATFAYKQGQEHRANLCLDVAVIQSGAADYLADRDHASNDNLVTFAEAKHMSAFAELVAGFIGMVHELQPGRLKRKKRMHEGHPKPFLFVSGYLNPTAQGILETIQARGFDIGLFDLERPLSGQLPRRIREVIPTKPAPDKRSRVKTSKAQKKDTSALTFAPPSVIPRPISAPDDDIPF